MKIALLHALPLDERMWEPQLPVLAGRDVHAPKLYDLGSSMDEWALGVLKLVPGRLVAVGASMGGYCAAAIARLAPERLDGIVLVGSRADADAPERRPLREQWIEIAREQGGEGLWEAAAKNFFPAGADPAVERVVQHSPLALVRLIAPTTTPERLTEAVRGASGFLYLISRLGVTGARDRVPDDLPEHVARVRAASALPLAVGFGISTPAQARAAAQLADGVVVGSALVEALGAGGLSAAERLVRDLVGAVRGNAT